MKNKVQGLNQLNKFYHSLQSKCGFKSFEERESEQERKIEINAKFDIQKIVILY